MSAPVPIPVPVTAPILAPIVPSVPSAPCDCETAARTNPITELTCTKIRQQYVRILGGTNVDVDVPEIGKVAYARSDH